MAKKKGNVFGAVVLYEKKHNRTSIGGGRVKTSTMNKSKRTFTYTCNENA